MGETQPGGVGLGDVAGDHEAGVHLSLVVAHGSDRDRDHSPPIVELEAELLTGQRPAVALLDLPALQRGQEVDVGDRLTDQASRVSLGGDAALDEHEAHVAVEEQRHRVGKVARERAEELDGSAQAFLTASGLGDVRDEAESARVLAVLAETHGV